MSTIHFDPTRIEYGDALAEKIHYQAQYQEVCSALNSGALFSLVFVDGDAFIVLADETCMPATRLLEAAGLPSSLDEETIGMLYGDERLVEVIGVGGSDEEEHAAIFSEVVSALRR